MTQWSDEVVEQIISAWAFAHNIDGAARNDLFARLRPARAALAAMPQPAVTEAMIAAAIDKVTEPYVGTYDLPLSDDWERGFRYALAAAKRAVSIAMSAKSEAPIEDKTR